MAKTEKTVVHVTLPTGEPRGIRIAEILNRTVQAFLVPRSMLDDFGHIGDWTRCHAVYLLVGASDGATKPDVYIGETTKLWGRLKLHDRDPDKDFWQTTVVLIKTNKGFGEHEIKWLEYWCISRATEVNRFNVVNGQIPAQRDEPDGMADVFGTLSTLLSVLGYPVFEPACGVRPTQTLFCTGPYADAKGALVADGFLVLRGSVARADIVDCGKDKLTPIQQELIDIGTLIREGHSLRFAQDKLFRSPSGAAAIVLGRPANGWSEWKDETRKPLADIRRADDAEESDDTDS